MSDKKIRLPSIDGFESSDSAANFKIFRKKIGNIYGGDAPLNERYGHKAQNRNIFNLRKREDLQLLLETSFNEPKEISKISRQLISLDPNYSKLISYYSDMFLVRYTVVPVVLDKTQEVPEELYIEKYNSMIEVADGLNLEQTIPEILQELFVGGEAYLTVIKNTTSKTISIVILPFEYCRTVLKTNLGTNLIEFNFKYFELFSNKLDREQVLQFFPDEFRQKWERHLAGETMGPGKEQGWLELDPRFSTSIMANERGMAPLINAMEGIFEYDRVRDAETQKTENQLKKIFVHRIPTTSNGELIFDLDEVREIHGAIARITRKHEGLDTITAFGDTELMSLQDESSVENKAITQAYQAVFNSAGLNSSLFMGDSQVSIQTNLKIDKGLVWKYIVQINNYINLVLNQLFNFKPLQAEVNLLPITVVEEFDQIKQYRENAAYGIGKLESIISTGVKQKHLSDRAKLEDVLQLDSLLRPLQSSHTQSGTQLSSDAAKVKSNGLDENLKEEPTNQDEQTENTEDGGED